MPCMVFECADMQDVKVTGLLSILPSNKIQMRCSKVILASLSVSPGSKDDFILFSIEHIQITIPYSHVTLCCAMKPEEMSTNVVDESDVGEFAFNGADSV